MCTIGILINLIILLIILNILSISTIGSGYLGVCRNGKKQSCERCGGDKNSLGHGIESGISWAILGAMTGPGAVKPEKKWIYSLIDQYQSAGVPMFLKDNLNWWRKIQEWPK
jgi:hypothetical protein